MWTGTQSALNTEWRNIKINSRPNLLTCYNSAAWTAPDNSPGIGLFSKSGKGTFGYASGSLEPARHYPGFRVRPAFFYPTSSKYAGQLCSGVELFITDASSYSALTPVLEILAFARRYPAFSSNGALERLWGGRQLGDWLNQNDPDPQEVLLGIQPYQAEFLEREGTNLSEGRGTTRPFSLIGAPWVDGFELACHLEARRYPGFRVRPAFFYPTSSKYAGQLCSGVELFITDASSYSALTPVLEILAFARRYPAFSSNGALERLWGGRQLGDWLNQNDPDPQEVLLGIQPYQAEFLERVSAMESR